MDDTAKKEPVLLTLQDLKVKFPAAYAAHVQCMLLDIEESDEEAYDESKDNTKFWLRLPGEFETGLEIYEDCLLATEHPDRGVYYWNGENWEGWWPSTSGEN